MGGGVESGPGPGPGEVEALPGGSSGALPGTSGAGRGLRELASVESSRGMRGPEGEGPGGPAPVRRTGVAARGAGHGPGAGPVRGGGGGRGGGVRRPRLGGRRPRGGRRGRRGTRRDGDRRPAAEGRGARRPAARSGTDRAGVGRAGVRGGRFPPHGDSPARPGGPWRRFPAAAAPRAGRPGGGPGRRGSRQRDGGRGPPARRSVPRPLSDGVHLQASVLAVGRYGWGCCLRVVRRGAVCGVRRAVRVGAELAVRGGAVARRPVCGRPDGGRVRAVASVRPGPPCRDDHWARADDGVRGGRPVIGSVGQDLGALLE